MNNYLTRIMVGRKVWKCEYQSVYNGFITYFANAKHNHGRQLTVVVDPYGTVKKVIHERKLH